MAEVDPRHASDYDDRTTVAVKSVLVEIGQVLGSYRGKFAVIGGAVPWLLLNQSDMSHIGTLDVDLALDADALGDGEYAQLVDSLLRQGYRQGEPLRRFQLKRTVPARDRGPDIDVIVDFLRPHDPPMAKNTPPLVADFAVQRADGADLALRFYQLVTIVSGCVKPRIFGEQQSPRSRRSMFPVTIQNGGSVSDQRSACRSSARL